MKADDAQIRTPVAAILKHGLLVVRLFLFQSIPGLKGSLLDLLDLFVFSRMTSQISFGQEINDSFQQGISDVCIQFSGTELLPTKL